MQSKSIYIASNQPEGGSLAIVIGLMSMLKGGYTRVAFFRPIIPNNPDNESDIDFMINHFELDMRYDECFGFRFKEYIEAYSNGTEDDLYQDLIHKVKELEKNYDFVVIEGSSRYQFEVLFDFDINLRIARNLGTLYIPILNAKDKSIDEVINEAHIISEAIDAEGCIHLATFINRCDRGLIDYLQNHLQKKENKQIYLLPEDRELASATLHQVYKEINATKIVGDDRQLDRLIYDNKIASMGVERYLEHINNGDLVIVAGDRVDIILASIVSFNAPHHANISGIILSGDIDLSDKVLSIIEDLDNSVVPIWSVKEDSFQTVKLIDEIKVKITEDDNRKISLAKGLFDGAVDKEMLSKQFFNISNNMIMTPVMFEYKILEQAQSNKMRIILPESSDDRVLRASEILLKRDIVDIILLGDEVEIEHRASQLRLDISKATIINPKSSKKMSIKFAHEFYEMRKDKGLSKKMACDTMDLVSYFATMMIYNGMADGMVSGAIHTTADTVRPALQIIKTKPNINIVSSLFFMCLDRGVLIYADCAINQNPNAEELATIAISSADSARDFGIEAKIAMLSYSTGDSGNGEDVKRVREATKIVQTLRPDLIVDGPMQYDAAIDIDVARQKLPESRVGGRATIFIFPDLNTGNNTYKAVQRSTGALAIGPILQGLKKPINDLSRGCSVDDIVNTVVITAIQAQTEKGERRL